MSLPLESRFQGALLGLAVGDALGARFEGQSPGAIARRYPTVERLIENPPLDVLHYTDDTQMAIGLAESLVEKGHVDRQALCRAFASNFEPYRGYGRGARAILEAMVEGRDHQRIAESYYPGGSYGNGAAMRVAPVGLYFHAELDRVWDEARQQSLPTHRHPLGVEGAQLLALAVAILARGDELSAEELLRRGVSREYVAAIEGAFAARDAGDLRPLGNGIAALDSVPTAIACHLLSGSSYPLAVGRAVLLGGDTDTIAAMAGALAGTAGGRGAIPGSLLERLEDERGAKGRSYIEKLARRLHDARP